MVLSTHERVRIEGSTAIPGERRLTRTTWLDANLLINYSTFHRSTPMDLGLLFLLFRYPHRKFFASYTHWIWTYLFRIPFVYIHGPVGGGDLERGLLGKYLAGNRQRASIWERIIVFSWTTRHVVSERRLRQFVLANNRISGLLACIRPRWSFKPA